jgi:hypothetical protein
VCRISVQFQAVQVTLDITVFVPVRRACMKTKSAVANAVKQAIGN